MGRVLQIVLAVVLAGVVAVVYWPYLLVVAEVALEPPLVPGPAVVTLQHPLRSARGGLRPARPVLARPAPDATGRRHGGHALARPVRGPRLYTARPDPEGRRRADRPRRSDSRRAGGGRRPREAGEVPPGGEPTVPGLASGTGPVPGRLSAGPAFGAGDPDQPGEGRTDDGKDDVRRDQPGGLRTEPGHLARRDRPRGAHRALLLWAAEVPRLAAVPRRRARTGSGTAEC